MEWTETGSGSDYSVERRWIRLLGREALIQDFIEAMNQTSRPRGIESDFSAEFLIDEIRLWTGFYESKECI